MPPNLTQQRPHDGAQNASSAPDTPWRSVKHDSSPCAPEARALDAVAGVAGSSAGGIARISACCPRAARARPAITIQFKTAEGIEAGKTKVKYKNVNIGEVKTMTLSEDLSHVRVKVELSRPAQRFAVKDARFWIVRPRVAASGVTGLNTLLSGAYIGVDPGRSAQA